MGPNVSCVMTGLQIKQPLQSTSIGCLKLEQLDVVAIYQIQKQTNLLVFNRPCVAGAVLQSAL